MTATMRAMWLNEQLDPSTVVNHIAHTLRLRARVDVDLLRRALQLVVDRNESLRSVVRVPDGRPAMRVLERVRARLPTFVHPGLDNARFEETVQGWILAPFDLESGPLFRFALFTRHEQDHLLAFAFHHLISDLWSASIVLGQVADAFECLRGGREVPARRARASFAERVAVEAEFLQSDEAAAALEWWKRELAGLSPTLDLPTDRPRSLDVGHMGGVVHCPLGADRVRDIRALARSLGCTPFVLLLTAYGCVLQRYCRTSDLAITTVRANRSARTALVGGCFVSPVLLRCRLDGDAPFREAVGTVARTVEGAFEHGAYPLQELVERLPQIHPTLGQLSGKVACIWHKTTRSVAPIVTATALGRSGTPFEFGGVAAETAAFARRPSTYELSMLVAEIGEDVTVSFEYMSDLFDEASVRRFAASFEALLGAALSDPSTSLGRLPVVAPAEFPVAEPRPSAARPWMAPAFAGSGALPFAISARACSWKPVCPFSSSAPQVLQRLFQSPMRVCASFSA